mgnify:CR=1 FL=1|jgi:hypothetical protein
MGGSVASRILTVKTTFALSSHVSCVCAFSSFVGASFVCMSDLVLFIYSNVAIYSPSNRSPLARLPGESDQALTRSSGFMPQMAAFSSRKPALDSSISQPSMVTPML